MKYKTRELSGARLDQAVAKACGYLYDKNISEDFIVTTLDTTIPPRPPEHVHREVCRVVIDGQERSFCPSSEWVHGGPIIERERISILPATKEVKADKNYRRRMGRHFMPEQDGWVAGYEPITHIEFDWGGASEVGSTPLIAAMRVFVLAKIGKEVDL